MGKFSILFVISIQTVKARIFVEKGDNIDPNAGFIAGSPEEGEIENDKHIISDDGGKKKEDYGGGENEGREERIVNRDGNIRGRLYRPDSISKERARPMSQFSDSYLFNTRVPSHRYTGARTYSDASHENKNTPSIIRVLSWILNWLFIK